VNIELLFFDGCPSWQRAWSELGTVLAETQPEATVRLRDVMQLPELERTGFAGSPTIRIDGADLEGYTGGGIIACRRYVENGGLGWPSVALLRQRIADAHSGRAASTSTGSTPST
jgi:hypothetical protein